MWRGMWCSSHARTCLRKATSSAVYVRSIGGGLLTSARPVGSVADSCQPESLRGSPGSSTGREGRSTADGAPCYRRGRAADDDRSESVAEGGGGGPPPCRGGGGPVR